MYKNLDNLSKEELINYILELKKELNNGKYGLFFDRKMYSEEIVEMCKNNIPILERVPELDIVNGEKNHIIIEGDNFHTLSALKTISSGEGFIDLITIDPPYNTGNDDFTFKDGFQHTEWLSFMEKRLYLAKDLLKKTGIIYINIDHNEYANLKLLCDKIFGEHNMLSSFIWVNNTKGRQISNGGAVKTYEYILLYAKDASLVDTFEGDIRELSKEMPLLYKDKNYKVFNDSKGKYVIKNELYNTNSSFNEETRPNLVYNIFYNDKDNSVIFGDVEDEELEQSLDSDYIKITPHINDNGTHKFHAWRWSKNKIIDQIDDLHFEKFEETYKIFTKIRNIYSTNIKDIISNSTNGNSELSKIIGKDKFSFPKPVKLIKRLIKNYVKREYVEETDEYLEDESTLIVLDFFAGSGTTGQAVLELNEEDNKDRIVILNTLNEVSDKVLTNYLRKKKILPPKSTKKQLNDYKKTEEYLIFTKTEQYNNLGISRAVTRERLQRVTSGTALEGEYSKKKIPANFRYFKTNFVTDNHYRDQAKYDLVEKVDGLLCILENTYDNYHSSTKFNLYSNDMDKKVVAIYNDFYEKESFDEMLNNIEIKKSENNVVYYFSLDNNVDETLEKLVKDKLPTATVKPIPSKIYEIYKKIAEDLRRDY